MIFLFIHIFFKSKTIYWGLGIGDWGLGIGDWAQSPIPNPHFLITNYLFILFFHFNKLEY